MSDLLRRSLLDPSPDNTGRSITTDSINLRQHCRGFYGGQEIQAEINLAKLWSVLTEFDTVLRQHVNIETPSLFKRSAALTIAFVAISPLGQPFSNSKLKIPDEILRLENHQNAIVAFEYIRFALHGAQITPKNREAIDLPNEIKVSKNQYYDIIHAIHKNKCDFNLLALLYEALAYTSNPQVIPMIGLTY